MKKIGRYLRNPVKRRKPRKVVRKRNPIPFALTTVNPVRKKKRKAARKNPPVTPVRTETRKVGASAWHHARGKFLYNPAKKKAAKRRRKNPLELRHALLEIPTKNPSSMSKKRKRSRRSGTRNPVSTKKRYRSSKRSRRNPSRKGGFRLMRNPIPVVSDVTTKENLTKGVAVLGGVVGTRWMIQRLISGDPTTGQRMFDLPGITYSTAAAPLTQAQFIAKNKIWLAFYEAAIPAVAGWYMKRHNREISEGLLMASVVNLGIAGLRGTQIGATTGLNAFLPRQRGMATYIPGVPPMLSGPATAFINNGSPVARANGMGAAVNGRWKTQTMNGAVNPFDR